MPVWQLSAFAEVRELGSGGSGRVVLARHLPTGTEVAVKYLADWLADDPDLLAGFRDEAQLMAGLIDPNLVTLYEYVETSAGAAIVMDLLEGVSLRRVITSDGPLTPEAALTVLKGSLLGLAALHRRGVAHRDYKPDNVIVDDAGRTTLIDYGIAAPVGEAAAASGTPRYMAPEQWRGEPNSAATDVYAATATFVECLTGHPVFSGDTVPHLLHQHLHTAPQLDDVPEAVRPLAVAGLAKDPADRIADATALVAWLDELAPRAYGEQWESHGRAHLAARAALLGLLFAHPPKARFHQAHAETDLGPSAPDADRGASDGGEPIGAAAVRSAGPTARRGPRRPARSAAVRRHLSTSALGLLLLLAALFAVLRGGGDAVAAAAFDSEVPTPGVVTVAPAAPPTATPAVTAPPSSPAPTPSAGPTTSAGTAPPGGVAPAPGPAPVPRPETAPPDPPQTTVTTPATTKPKREPTTTTTTPPVIGRGTVVQPQQPAPSGKP